ncbi:hypothetical protein KP79_PYT16201 [Mizuhopecten yessoensis]|uniref:Mutator-like transposase domain-containing protein n=1 Tax=Mizuhopecten yessoensis TaxID=6573 RepID=A0A210PRP8_MIZYE|nr:hypothetical protein KP79_PYT16201 [Mizuhopecten yessoensis]
MKGDTKRRKDHFQPGHIPKNKGHTLMPVEDQAGHPNDQTVFTRRLTTEEFKLVTKHSHDGRSLIASDTEDRPCPVRILRPSTVPHEDSDSEPDNIEGNIIIDVLLMVKMWNSVFSLHAEKHYETCKIPEFDLDTESKRAMGWSCFVWCAKCSYRSPLHKFYREADTNKPGPKPALVNRYLPSALCGQSVSTKGARLLLRHLNIPARAKSGMQRQANLVSKKITALNKIDMAEKTRQVVEVNHLREDANPSTIGIALDGRYNSTSFGSAKKPGMNASQGMSLGIETSTPKKWIVARTLQNKLCWTGAWLRGKGYDVNCPGGHPDCTANTDRYDGLSEHAMGKNIGDQLTSQGILVKYATTDGDGTGAKGIEEAMQALDPMWKVERLADPTHLGKAQFRKSNSAKFSESMFPGRTRLMRAHSQKIFSQDLKARSSLIFKDLMKLHNGNMDIITKRLPAVLDATVACYSGDCSKCKQHSVVCSGGDSNNWWTRSMLLSVNKIHGLQMTSDDEMLVLELLKMKLSTNTVQSMRLNTSTQKNEGCHRTLNVFIAKVPELRKKC